MSSPSTRPGERSRRGARPAADRAPELEQHFAGDRLDAVFVKHLESVQGDERDVIIFSVGYGRDGDGKFTMNFGPLNKDGGYRRLNVAVTRARELVEVVSSVRAADFTLSETASRGATPACASTCGTQKRMARRRKGHSRRRRRTTTAPVEEAIGEVVRELGFEPVPQVGAGSFRIDIAVRDPTDTGDSSSESLPTASSTAQSQQRAIAIACARKSSRNILGWRIHRIWALDWVRNRQAEVERLRDAIERSSVMTTGSIVEEPPEDPRADRTRRSGARQGGGRQPPPVGRGVQARGAGDAGDVLRVSRERGSRAQRDLVVALVEVEAPVHIDYVIQRLAQAWGLKRAGHRVRSAALQAIKMAVRNGLVEQRGALLWRPGQELVFVRSAGSIRSAYAAIDRADRARGDRPRALRLIEASGGSAGEHVFSDVAKVLGFDRVGATIQNALRERLSAIQAIALEHD